MRIESLIVIIWCVIDDDAMRNSLIFNSSVVRKKLVLEVVYHLFL